MPRKPAPSAYILALALRKVVRENEKKKTRIYTANKSRRNINQEYINIGIPKEYWFEEIPEDFAIFWANVITELDHFKDVRQSLALIQDEDYKTIIFDAIKQPYNKVRKSKGFQYLVPVLMTVRRYDALNELLPMGMTEEEARDFADMAWQQEMENFPHGIDPINKQIITNRVARELAEANVKYIGEEIVGVEFNDAELDAYELEHEEVMNLLQKGFNTAYELFDYDPDATFEENQKWVRNAICMYNSMLGKNMSDLQIDLRVCEIIGSFQILQRLIE